MQQLDLVERMLADTPRARNSDPITSHIAAARIKAIGTLAAHQTKILAAVRSHPGSTYVELAALTGLERHAVGRRLGEIQSAGYIKPGQPVNRGGRLMRAWYPV
jgi:DNA-binding MarR family transcriptional regulator